MPPFLSRSSPPPPFHLPSLPSPPPPPRSSSPNLSRNTPPFHLSSLSHPSSRFLQRTTLLRFFVVAERNRLDLGHGRGFGPEEGVEGVKDV
ncbi:hypothetical protein Fmac_017454 [Flemingia macrophylla]|uniref:Uncharacterized protein n=1 Tax=Flemingia macrophylla TaxID=520843 RepID=A0ABD1M279_9FABA